MINWFQFKVITTYDNSKIKLNKSKHTHILCYREWPGHAFIQIILYCEWIFYYFCTVALDYTIEHFNPPLSIQKRTGILIQVKYSPCDIDVCLVCLHYLVVLVASSGVDDTRWYCDILLDKLYLRSLIK